MANIKKLTDKDIYMKAIANSGKAVYHTRGHDSFQNILPNISVREGFGEDDFAYFRSKEGTPTSASEAIGECMEAYTYNAIVHNVIDLMADFACQGIDLVCPSKKEEKIYKKWAKKVELKERAERFLNTLYRAGNVIVYTATAKLKPSEIEKLDRSYAADLELLKSAKLERGEIPIRYVFLNPTQVEIEDPEIAAFSGKKNYALKISPTLAATLHDNKKSKDLSDIPKSILNAVDKKNRKINLPPEKVRVFHYKKDDWKLWSMPMINHILDDIKMLDRLRLADRAALDGIISSIRIWTLGSLEYEVYPADAAISRLESMLLSNVGGGTMDLIWGPDLVCKSTDTEAYKFLGQEKYSPTLNNIYAGLGIPATLTGSSTDAGFTNNFISLKTLIERLKYGREIFVKFLEEQLKIVKESLGLKSEAFIRFDRMVLADEATERKLLIELVDRNLVSIETVQERIGEIPELESRRIKRESKLSKPEKLGPYTSQENTLERIKVQKTVKEGKNKVGVSGEGRPQNSKDTEQRKQKEVKPKKKMGINPKVSKAFSWVADAYKDIAEILIECTLNSLKKKNIRSLTTAEFNSLEKLKFNVLCNVPKFTKVTHEVIANTIKLPLVNYYDSVYAQVVSSYRAQFDKDPTIEEVRNLQILVYSLEGEQDDDI